MYGHRTAPELPRLKGQIALNYGGIGPHACRYHPRRGGALLFAGLLGRFLFLVMEVGSRGPCSEGQ